MFIIKSVHQRELVEQKPINLINNNLANVSDRLKIEGSNVMNMDIPATNGVIQVVESVIELPGSILTVDKVART